MQNAPRQTTSRNANPKPPQPPPRRRRRGLTAQMSAMSISNRGLLPGQIKIAHNEMIMTITTTKSGAGKAKTTSSVLLRPSAFQFAKNLAASFQRYRFDRLAIRYVPGVGTDKTGMISIGVDWDITQGAKDRPAIAALTPNLCDSIHLAGRAPAIMNIPASRLRGRPWYQVSKTDQDGSPASLHVAAETGTEEMTVGEVWVMYTITFDGTVSA